MGVYFEDSSGNPILNFQYIDMVYDEIIRIGMKPFVELSFMPDALASAGPAVNIYTTFEYITKKGSGFAEYGDKHNGKR